MPSILLEDGPLAGWRTWPAHDHVSFGNALGQIWWTDLPDGRVRVRIETQQRHVNGAGFIHGGFLMSFADMALYAGAWHSLKENTAVTLTCNTEFLGAGLPGKPLEAICEVLQETGKLIFLRGLVEQEQRPIIAFSATLRKVPRDSHRRAGDRQD